ncbi:unnamed protein product [Strongylus vulgaris]|uniref:GMP reductase n=1 Tax=Strongylus vulgaris TaxID=40348 RepID=A0A3P7L271_STRVU|nr:unnamed protein product [Strongylus vulgaris]
MPRIDFEPKLDFKDVLLRPKRSTLKSRADVDLVREMPRIDFEPKLDFKDVLLRPKRSTLKSRADVDLVREYTFKNSKKTYSGVPIVASNMDTVGTFEMASALARHKLFTTIHKHYSVSNLKHETIDLGL